MVGYARVSTSDQDNSRQIASLIAAGVDERDIFTDTASGKNMKRPGWEGCWRDIQAGDLLVVQAIDRLGRDVSELFRVLRELHERGADLKVIMMDLDTRTPAGRLIFGVLALVAQWEREQIVYRTKDGLKRAAAEGRRGGTRPLFDDKEYTRAFKRFGINEGAKSLGITRQGLLRALARIERDKGKKK